MKRWIYIAGGILLLLIVVGVGAMHYAARSIKTSIEEALGPEGEAAEINVRLTTIELVDVRIGAPKGWPTDSTLRAKRVVVVPDLRHLMSDHVEIVRIDVEGGYLSVVRPKEGGGLKVLPTLAERARKKKREGAERRGVTVHTAALSNSVIEVFDSTLGGSQKVRMESVKGTISDILVPELDTRTRVDLAGAVRGGAQNGTLSIKGWVEIAKKNAELATHARHVDLALFEPYLVTKLKSGVDRGTFTLDLKSSVRNNVVNASGTLTVSSLKLKAAENPIEALAGLPRRAALSSMENPQGDISVPFTLAGNLDDPKFSLAGEASLKTGVAVAKAFGMSFEGLVHAFFIIVNGLGGAFGALVPG
jgi:hypothetical protein